jgi:hypothetical protein
MRKIIIFATIAIVGSCKPSAPGNSDAAGPAASASVASDAQVQAATDPDPVVDLLHTIDCTVAVSSKVDNPHDYPEHLVDGKAETAWNGKTGDLLTGWIAFRVPKTAKVVRIEMTSGFDKTSAKGDLFTMNHRIKRVKVTRGEGGQLVKEATLDITKRGLQAIDIDAANGSGGDFKIEVLETAPGTEKNWRELTVSEFRVWGRKGGAPENPAHIPKMAIGSLDGVPPPKPVTKVDPPRGPFPTTAALCAAYDKIMTPQIDAKYTDNDYPGRLPPPHCTPETSGRSTRGFSSAKFKVPESPFKDAIFAGIDDTERQHQKLLVQTDKGWFRTDVSIVSRHISDPGCMHSSDVMFEDVTFAKTSTDQSVAIIRIVNRDIYWGSWNNPELDGAFTVERAYACRSDDKQVTCEGPKELATAHEKLPGGDPSAEPFRLIQIEKIPWKTRKKAVVGAAGDLRAE